MLCKVNPHEKVLGLCLGTSLSVLSIHGGLTEAEMLAEVGVGSQH